VEHDARAGRSVDECGANGVSKKRAIRYHGTRCKTPNPFHHSTADSTATQPQLTHRHLLQPVLVPSKLLLLTSSTDACRAGVRQGRGEAGQGAVSGGAAWSGTLLRMHAAPCVLHHTSTACMP
jgi:hypothetical protein